MTRCAFAAPAVLAAVVLVLSTVAGPMALADAGIAHELLDTAPPAELERRLAENPAYARATMQALGEALSRDDDALAARLVPYLAALARARGALLVKRGGPWRGRDVGSFVALQLVDPERFAAEPEFRPRVRPVLLRAFDPTTPSELRDQALSLLVQFPGVDYELSEDLAVAWGAAPRRSDRRRESVTASWRFADPRAPIAASVYSLPSSFFDPAAVEAFLRGLRQAAPKRPLIVLGNLPLRWRLRETLDTLAVRWIETYGRNFSPWPRDPMSFARAPSGAVRVLVRPNVQPERPIDQNLGRMLVHGLPQELDATWREVRWGVSPVPFHNGKILLTGEAAWIGIDSLEIRILELLGEEAVPVASFATAAGIDRYLDAAARAADELSTLYGRPARFVHPLPSSGPLGERTRAMETLGGGAGFDLDSLLTFLPHGAALVADLSAGEALLARLEPAEIESFAQGYDLAPRSAALHDLLLLAQQTPRARRLDLFLDLIARHLAAGGRPLRRLPLLRIPTDLLRDREGVSHVDFLLTWNNVVVEERGGRTRAEGFASLLPSGDRKARESFRALGSQLDLLPPLVHSVVLSGGYRCASNHLRAEFDARGPKRSADRSPPPAPR